LAVFISSFTDFFRSTRALQPAFISSVLAVKGRDELAALALDRSAPLQTPDGVTGFAKKKSVFKGAKDMKNDASSTSRQDVYSRVTSQIVASLEQGVRPWVKPWNAEHAAGRITQPLRFNGQPYSGINILSLWMSATAQGFAAPIWMTFRQAIELDAHVRKGEKGSLVVYANAVTRTEHDEDTGEDFEREIPYLKGYTVFNVEQIDGLPDRYYAKVAPQLNPVARLERAETFFAASKATIRHGGKRAYYVQELDYVQMPSFESFRDAESYYSTLAHEMTHWTKHPSRLARDLGRRQWGDQGYAQEELVAELGAAFLCADLELAAESREENTSYIANWLEVLKNDTRFIFKAAVHAQRAAAYLRAFSGADAGTTAAEARAA
jgi:antirestriction protein ArdC